MGEHWHGTVAWCEEIRPDAGSDADYEPLQIFAGSDDDPGDPIAYPDVACHDNATAEANAARLVACWNACVDLTPEQVDAIPRLVAWFRSPLPDDADEAVAEYASLETLFPMKEA